MTRFLVRIKKCASFNLFNVEGENFAAGQIRVATKWDDNEYYINDCIFFEKELTILRELP